MSNLHRTMMRHSRPPVRRYTQDFSPVSWRNYFDYCRNVTVNNDRFRVYVQGDEGIKLVLLHGGGYSALTWALFAGEITQKIVCQVYAIDIRGHGESHTDNDHNLSLAQLTQDVVAVVHELNPDNEAVVFIGHSMGGALAVYCAEAVTACVGLCVIDVVEGTALESLSNMQSVIRSRPANFSTVESAVQWCMRSGMTQNLDAARVSMPGQIKNSDTNVLASSEVEHAAYPSEETAAATGSGGGGDGRYSYPVLGGFAPIAEEPNHLLTNHVVGLDGARAPMMMPNPSQASAVTPIYNWRIDLSTTEVYWRGWFQGLSEHFLNCPVPKLLLLASISGLDTPLMVGQMQGKFQMQLLPRCGHAIHEDMPDQVANVIGTFLVRHRLTEAIGNFTPTFPNH